MQENGNNNTILNNGTEKKFTIAIEKHMNELLSFEKKTKI